MADPIADQIPENLSPTDALALYEKLSAGTPDDDAAPGTSGTEPAKDSSAAPAEEKKPEVVPGEGEGDEHTADGIQSKNGKHVLPFTVLAGEREQRQAAQRERDEINAKYQQAQTELEQLRAKQNSTPGDADTERAAELMDKAGDLTDAELLELKEDFPTVYKAVAKLQSVGKSLEEQFANKVDPMQQAYASAQERQANQQREAVQEAIDTVPKLAHIQANDPAMFAVAQQFDVLLVQQAAWKDKPMAERFAKAVEMAESSTGKTIDLGTTKAGAADLKAAAVAKAKEQHSEMPASLQQFPAGAAPKETAIDEIQNLSAAQIAQKLQSMSPAEQAAYFAKL
ncbi:hypothetical protein [Comamonas koreensis]|uniref:hypothetical protein n=1 Tax=Comamonas koreensis TaxID=160825 RepID=UPI0015F9B88F|nr:hypothetical protein [Comamonas koreensis]